MKKVKASISDITSSFLGLFGKKEGKKAILLSKWGRFKFFVTNFFKYPIYSWAPIKVDEKVLDRCMFNEVSYVLKNIYDKDPEEVQRSMKRELAQSVGIERLDMGAIEFSLEECSGSFNGERMSLEGRIDCFFVFKKDKRE